MVARQLVARQLVARQLVARQLQPAAGVWVKNVYCKYQRALERALGGAVPTQTPAAGCIVGVHAHPSLYVLEAEFKPAPGSALALNDGALSKAVTTAGVWKYTREQTF